jgi:plastocyanin
VPVGGKVVVTNTDGASHTWTAVDGAFDSGTLAEGQSFEFTFDEPGTYEYRCNIHPTMTGTITVTG